MNVHATLVVGADGSTSFLGSSDGITSPEDRTRFLARRRQSDVIIVGGNTARHERYRRTPVPLVVLSHALPEIITENSQAHWWNLSPAQGVARALSEFGPSVSIEGGVTMIQELLSLNLISHFDLSVTSAVGGGNLVDPTEILSHFQRIEKSEVNGTVFYSCSEPIT